MIKRAISLFIVIALSFSFGAFSVGAWTDEEKIRSVELFNSIIHDDLTDEERTQAWNELDEIQYGNGGPAGRLADVLQLMGGDPSGFFDYLQNEWIPEYEASGGAGTRDEYEDPEMAGYTYQVKGYNGGKSLIYIDRFTATGAPFLCSEGAAGLAIAVPNKTGRGTWYYADTMEFYGYRDMPRNYILDSVISHNLPIYFENSETEETYNSGFGDSFQNPNQIPRFAPETLTPDELIDLLEDAAKDYVIDHPDFTTPEGILINILLTLQKAQEKNLDNDTLQVLAEQLACKCPTAAEINAAILQIMGDDNRSLTDVVDVLLEVRDGVVNIDETLQKLGNISFADMETMSAELLPNAPSIADTLIAKLSELKGVEEFLTISSALRDFQEAITNPGGAPNDITINLEFLGADDVTIFKASDFKEGGKFSEGLTIAKSILSVFILGFWLNLMRKRFVYLFEAAGNT
ncbi:MAG: hypothetical protein LBM59_04090 [Ruminococcus sp.]|jgi:hypothetical protein|nr:hypothetical protein [Ruminococcus sp.]